MTAFIIDIDVFEALFIVSKVDVILGKIVCDATKNLDL